MKRVVLKNNRCVEELDRQFKRIYEDVARMKTKIAKEEEVTADFERFPALELKYTDARELTPIVVNEVISKIVIHAPGTHRRK